MRYNGFVSPRPFDNVIVPRGGMYVNGGGYKTKMYLGGVYMNNVLLGKTIKAMYKQSGKTIAQLSEQTDLTIDTINNLFYARIQKPGLSGVCTLVKAMGYRPAELIDFMDSIEDVEETADITERFTSFINSVRDTDASASAAKSVADTAKDGEKRDPGEIGEQITEGFRAQIEQLKQSSRELSAHFERSIAGINENHEKGKAYLKEQISEQKKTIRRLGIMLGCVIFSVFALLFIDALNMNVGWFR